MEKKIPTESMILDIKLKIRNRFNKIWIIKIKVDRFNKLKEFFVKIYAILIIVMFI